jgi:hypothetical protein
MTIKLGEVMQYFPRLQRGHGFGTGKRIPLKVDDDGPVYAPRSCRAFNCNATERSNHGHLADRAELAQHHIDQLKERMK